MAAYYNDKDIVNLLVSKGADLNSKDEVSTALIIISEIIPVLFS